jgi:hypothetical protein
MGLRLRLGSILGVALDTNLGASGRQTLPKSGEYIVPGVLGPFLERVMNLGENRIEMGIARSAWFPPDFPFPYSLSLF